MKTNSSKHSIKRLTTKTLTLGSVLATSLLSFSISAITPKHIAVPPSDMAAQKQLSPDQKGIFSENTMLPISARKSLINQKILMDQHENNSILFLSPTASNWNMSVTNVNGKMLINENSKELPVTSMSIGKQTFSGKQLNLNSSAEGEWQVQLKQKDNIKTPTADGYLMFKGDPNYKLYSHLDSNITTKNNNINIIAYMVNDQNRAVKRSTMLNKQPMQSTITNAYVLITSPSKVQKRIDLNDRGINGDKLAGDGLYSAKIPTAETGIYTSQVQVKGIRPDGIKFSRTTTDIYPIAETSFKMRGKVAQLKYANNKTVISLPVKSLTNATSVFMSAEVWGTNSNGKRESAAWVGGVVSPNSLSKETNLELNFDTRWLKRKNLRAPFALKSVRLQTVDNNVPLVEIDKIKLQATNRVTTTLPFKSKLTLNDFNKSGIAEALSTTNTEITKDMLMGEAPAQIKSLNKSSGSKLLLVHGYCSDPVWDPNHFTDAAVFEDYNQNRSNEAFAQEILSFGSSYSSYGIVAHSQGGAAALHLYSRYWSGLDYANGGRLIQSVGTPYQGTALAGNLAALGEIFGVGCGYNTDLTYNGASNWLSTIPNWARSQVDYYTTSFTDKWWRWDYCHIASDLVLSDPDDGTTEKWAGQLPGGVNRGHTTGQCHTLNMRDPGQTHDTSRNASMNSRAAR